MKYNIDQYKVGQFVNISLPSLDNDSCSHILTVIILKKNITSDDWVTYDIGFNTRDKYGNISGLIIIPDLCVWRYFKADEFSHCGIPSKEFLGEIRNRRERYYFTDLKKEDLCYMIDKDGISFFVYPFKQKRTLLEGYQ